MKYATLTATAVLVAGLTAFSVQRADNAPDAARDDVAASADVASSTVDAGSASTAARARYDEYASWQRPDVPVRVALQAGHWKAAEAPDEQRRLRTNGTRGGGKAEWEVNLAIAQHTARMLEDAGIAVEILPTTIPPAYWADLFVSIHADGNASSASTGYRAAAPRRDRTGRAREFVEILNRSYGEATGMAYYPTITRRMTSYYAFNSRRYTHALHPMTVGAIIETGFLTSARDRRIIIGEPERAARGIADAIISFLEPVVAEQNARATRQEPAAP